MKEKLKEVKMKKLNKIQRRVKMKILIMMKEKNSFAFHVMKRLGTNPNFVDVSLMRQD